MTDMEVREFMTSEKADAIRLVWDVFLEFEAPDYTEEGIRTFRDFIHDEEAINELRFYGAYEKEKLAGVIATRHADTHIALFFVRSNYQKRGIGRKLFETVLKNCTTSTITVNSSPYATEVYNKLGFVDTDTEQTVKGMRFTPMQYQKVIPVNH
ncbi:GNAT family N-acetyltransferase [Pelosinus baikalensis]|uniref:GNAT family N-acetyltransferase n=1 Tax=Pelosinus baikalensis TaxID=2892015 RepID=A0ABS8HZB5_9FIRM|nr:GNAT family N-acetyltransferase [Pelosinus baikalensis]MCC5468480.1 GNAT family N-acetyltransferase [Pelosinus baikalensis]